MSKQGRKFKIVRFDVPYNFDKDLIHCLKVLQRGVREVDYCSIYLPPLRKDEFSSIRGDTETDVASYISEDDYISHINAINDAFPGKIMLLMQQKNYIMPDDRIMFYHNLGINKFCVNGLEKAKAVRRLIPDAEIWCSLTAKLMPDDIVKNKDKYKGYFDGIILFWYPYNKNIQIVQRLPKDFKYMMIVNAGCSQKCNGNLHWDLKDTTPFECPFNPMTPQENSLIPPDDVLYFLPYLYALKLQDRRFLTGEIIAFISAYALCDRLFDITLAKPKLSMYTLDMFKDHKFDNFDNIGE